MIFQILVAVVAILSGAVAALAGFGIGSLLTPMLAVKMSLGVAVAGVSIAHFFGTALRFFFLRRSVDHKVVISFGLTSAAGGLSGAFFSAVFIPGPSPSSSVVCWYWQE